MSEYVVIDSSYIIEAILPTKESQGIDAEIMIKRMQRREIIGVVPLMFFAEVASVCARRVRSKHLDDYDAEVFLKTLHKLAFNVHISPTTSMGLYKQALGMNAQVYDSMYVALAKSKDFPIATVDSGMKQAATNCKVALYAH